LSVLTGYLTSHQARVWNLFRKGMSQSEIASNLGVTRQAIHKTVNTASDRVLNALLDAAHINKLDIRKVDPTKGVLVGYSPGFRSRVFLTYSPKNGVQLWYEHKGQCEGCQRREECTQRLLDTAKEWEVDLTQDEKRLPPTRLAERLFSEVVEES
jgi:transcriptional regulator with XRE-family HTH domain